MTNITSKLYPIRRLKKARINKNRVSKINKKYKGRHNIISRSFRQLTLEIIPINPPIYSKTNKILPHHYNKYKAIMVQKSNFNLKAWFKQKVRKDLNRQAELYGQNFNLALKQAKLNNKRLIKDQYLIKKINQLRPIKPQRIIIINRQFKNFTSLVKNNPQINLYLFNFISKQININSQTNLKSMYNLINTSHKNIWRCVPRKDLTLFCNLCLLSKKIIDANKK